MSLSASSLLHGPDKKRHSKSDMMGRRYERIPFPAAVKIVTAGEDGLRDGWCIDISEGGVAFVAEEGLHIMDVLELSFEVAGEQAFRQYARLLYRSGERYGASFIDLE